jgi:hypothetical protein
MIPWIAAGAAPLTAARIVMGLTAVFFLLATWRLYGNLGLPRAARWGGVVITAPATVFWSINLITPDLLVGGLMVLTAARMISPRWAGSSRYALLTGLVGGIAYLAKPVALPYALLLTLGISGLVWMTAAADLRRIARGAVLTLLGVLVVASPWIVILSLEHDAVTITTSSRATHALHSPANGDRRHPFRQTFHVPEEGRFFSWEDPPSIPGRHWSPLSSPAAAQRQARVIWDGLNKEFQLVRAFDVFGIGIFSLFAALLAARPWRPRMRRERWRWAVIPTVSLLALYLPFATAEQRYFFSCYPLTLAAALGLLNWMSQQVSRRRLVLLLGGALLCFSYGYPIGHSLAATFRGLDRMSVQAHAVAGRLSAAGIQSPVANVDGKGGIFVAYYLGVPWYGEEHETSVERVRASQAGLIVVLRGSPMVDVLAGEPDFEDLERIVNPAGPEATQPPWKVFRLLLDRHEVGDIGG